MVNQENLISENEASIRAGVSARTLQRFAEAGYLRVVIQPDASRHYSLSEINDIFGHSRGAAPVNEDVSNEAPQVVEDRTITETIEPAIDLPLNESPARPLESETKIVTTEPEISALRTIIKTQTDMLDAKDAEIADLRSQRDWLRARVERLEEKSERDQILLLSETQTIRRLITLQEQRKSTFRQVLDWFGFQNVTPSGTLPAQTGPQGKVGGAAAIEVQKAANG